MRTKVEENEEVLAQRQALVESKSPVELSEIHSLAEVPIPSRIEAWLHGSNASPDGYVEFLWDYFFGIKYLLDFYSFFTTFSRSIHRYISKLEL